MHLCSVVRACRVGLIALCGLVGLSGLSGCKIFFPIKTPIPTRTYRLASCPKAQRTLLVLLPGRFMDVGQFEKHGIIDALKGSGLAMDAVVVDAHLGYYMRRTLIERLREDVIGPARRAGYRRIVLAGISMGGMGAMLYAQAHPEEVDALLLVAPGVNDEDIPKEVRAAGGLRKWNPKRPLPEDDWERKLWCWLKGYCDPEKRRPPITLGFGTGDRFAPACELLAEALPQERVHRFPGGHDWAPWKAVFGAFFKQDKAP